MGRIGFFCPYPITHHIQTVLSNMEDISRYLTDLQSIQRINQLEHDSNIELYKITGSIKLRNKIIEYYLPMIPQLLLRYVNQGIDIPDLLQTSNEALIDVISTLPYNDDIDNLRGYIISSINHAIVKVLNRVKADTNLINDLRELQVNNRV